MPLTFVNDSAPALLQSILTASQNAVIAYRAVRSTDGAVTDLRLAMLNSLTERQLGVSSVEALDQPFTQLFPHLAKTDLFNRYQHVVETGQPVQFEFQYTRPNQPKPFWCDVSVVKLNDNIVVSCNDPQNISDYAHQWTF